MYSVPNLLVKDESKNPFGTCKDRKSEFIIDRAEKAHVDKIVCITSGNTGYSLARFAEGTNIRVVCVVDKNLSYSIRKRLELYAHKVIDVDLSKKIFGSKDVIKMARESYNELIWDVTNGYEKAFQTIIEEIKTENPDLLLTPVGGGETIVGLYRGLKKYGLKTKLVGVGVKGPSMADKLYVPTGWTPYTNRIEAIMKKGHQYIRLSEKEVKEAFEKVNNTITCEPSAAVVSGGLSKLNIDSKDKVILINSGRGLV